MDDDPAIQIQPARLRGLVRPDRTDNSRSRFRRSRFAGASSTASPPKKKPRLSLSGLVALPFEDQERAAVRAA
jgi:hypothetical protein